MPVFFFKCSVWSLYKNLPVSFMLFSVNFSVGKKDILLV